MEEGDSHGNQSCNTGATSQASAARTDNNWNPDCVEPDLPSVLIALDPSFSESQLQMLKIAISQLDIECTSLENCASFVEVYRLLEQKVPDQAVAIAIAVFIRIGISKLQIDNLKPFVNKVFAWEDQLIMDLVLTLGEILMNMRSDIYGSFMELVRRRFLPNFNADRLSCHAKLLEVLLSRSLISESYLRYYFEWIDRSGCSNQLERLRKFCARHNIEEPPWNQVSRSHSYCAQSSFENGSVTPSQCTDGGGVQPQMSESLPTFVSKDGSGGANQGDSDTSGKEGLPSSNDIGNVTHPFQCTAAHDHADSTAPKVTDQSDLQDLWEEPVQHASEDEERSRLVIQNQHTRAPPTDCAEVRGDGRKEDHPSESILTAVSIKTQTKPIDINSSTVPPPAKQNVTHTKDPNQPDPNKDLEKESNYRCLTKGEWSCWMVIFGIAKFGLMLALICFGVWLWYSWNNLLLIDHPRPTFGYVGSNTTNLLGCFDTSVTREVHIEEAAEQHSIANFDAKLFKVDKSDLKTEKISLISHFHSFDETYTGQNVAANYLYGDTPVFVASQGNLTFHVTLENRISPSDCSLQFYLFKKSGDYQQFLGSNDASPAQHFPTSGCFPAGKNKSKIISFAFPLPSSGFYFIAAHIKEHVEVNVTIGGFLTSYDTSSIPHEDCSLDSDNHHCTMRISSAHVPSSSNHHVCILSMSSVVENSRVRITVKNVDWNVWSVLSSTLAVLFVLIWVTCFIFSAVFCCIRVRVRIRNGYREIRNV